MANNTGHKLYGVFKSKYLGYHGRAYNGNLYRDAAMIKKVAEEIGESTLLDLMSYYFEKRSHHEVQWLCFNYDSLSSEMELSRRDAEKRRLLRERTRQRMQELDVPSGFDGESLKYFVCSECGREWTRPPMRGRPPKNCYDCRRESR